MSIFSQSDWTNSNMKINQLIHNEKSSTRCKLYRPCKTSTVTSPVLKILETIQTQKKLFINGKEFTLFQLDWRDSNNGNYLSDSLIGNFGYPWYIFKRNSICMDCVQLLYVCLISQRFLRKS